MNEKLKALYNRAILSRHKKPPGLLKQASAEYIIPAYNPICGDQFDLYFDLRDDRISNISFYGHGCAISTASTSLLVEEINNKNIADAGLALGYFYYCLQGKEKDMSELYAGLALSSHYPGREQCARLSWDAFHKFYKDHK